MQITTLTRSQKEFYPLETTTYKKKICQEIFIRRNSALQCFHETCSPPKNGYMKLISDGKGFPENNRYVSYGTTHKPNDGKERIFETLSQPVSDKSLSFPQ